ncbi:hypothetical protein MKX03_020273 [Papaver bracteatum]|nr:hypothetical protein MKX03_020273 [Papaver bracteatum]
MILEFLKPGEYVVREGEIGDGIYLNWEGEAEVHGSQKVEGEDRSEMQLKAYDYFGHGTLSSYHQVDVIPLTKGIPIEVNIFHGLTLPDAPRFARVFGGQLVGHACFYQSILLLLVIFCYRSKGISCSIKDC